MSTFIKWIFMLVVAVFAWLIGIYTTEYLRPFQKITISKYK